MFDVYFIHIYFSTYIHTLKLKYDHNPSQRFVGSWNDTIYSLLKKTGSLRKAPGRACLHVFCVLGTVASAFCNFLQLFLISSTIPSFSKIILIILIVNVSILISDLLTLLMKRLYWALLFDCDAALTPLANFGRDQSFSWIPTLCPTTTSFSTICCRRMLKSIDHDTDWTRYLRYFDGHTSAKLNLDSGKLWKFDFLRHTKQLAV